MSDAWYCVETQHKQERVALLNLTRQHFCAFLPMTVEIQVHDGRRQDVEVPLFERYLFTRFDVDNDPWRRVGNTIGVKRLVSFGTDKPTRVPNNAIEGLIVLGSTPQPDTPMPAKVIVKNARVRVIKGPLAGKDNATGICQWAKKDRVALLMSAMSGEVVFEFDRDAVELVEEC